MRRAFEALLETWGDERVQPPQFLDATVVESPDAEELNRARPAPARVVFDQGHVPKRFADPMYQVLLERALDPTEHQTVRAAAIRACHEAAQAERTSARLAQMQADDVQARSGIQQRGLTKSIIESVRLSIIGPPTDQPKSDKVDEPAAADG